MNKKKICLLGVFGSGKTSLVRRFVYNTFDEKYLSTIGVNISQKLLPPLENSSGKSVQLNFLIWDIEGADQSFNIPYNYYIGSSGAIIVVDLLREQTIEEVPRLIEKFREVVPQGKIVVAANKADAMRQDSDTLDKLEKLCKTSKVPLLVTSAKTEQNVEEVFLKLGEIIIEHN